MAERISMRQMRREAPEWIFSWKRRGEPILPKLIAVAFAVAMFGGLMGFFRIRAAAPNPWGLAKASVIQVLPTPEGRALSLEAREKGPSPARFSSADWPSLIAFENDQLARLSEKLEPYQPQLRTWQDPPPSVPALTRPGAMVLPPLPEPVSKPPPPGPGVLRPAIWPLSGLTAEEIPQPLPAYEGEVDAAMQADSLRFMVQIDGEGVVQECIALSGGDTPESTAALTAWLRGIRFLRKAGDGMVWAAFRIRFLNQSP
jgi:hypothetical protein